MVKVVLDSWHFEICSIGESSWFHSLFKKFKTCACGMYVHSTSIICAPPCWISFVHTKSMLLKGDFLGFWISIDWNLEAWPMFETKCELIVQYKILNWCQCTKFYTCNTFIYMLIVIFDTNANVHVPSTWFVSLT